MEKTPRLSDRLFRRLGVVAIAILVIGGAFLANHLMHKPQAEPYLIPQRLETGVEFRPGRTLKEKPRTIHRDANGVMESADVPYETGVVAHIHYFTAGVVQGMIKSAEVFYAPADGADQGPKLRELKYDDATGMMLTFDRIYWEDGKLQHKGDQVGVRYESFDYRRDGAMVQKHQLFYKAEGKWALDLAEDFHLNGALAKSMVRLADGSFETRSYTDQKVLAEFQALDKYKSHATTEQYEADGKTVKTHIEETAGGTDVKTFTNGVVTLEREFTYSVIQTVPVVMWVTVNDASGKPLYRQRWLMDWTVAAKLADHPPVKLEASLYTLTEVQYVNEKGDVTKDIDFYPDAKTPKKIEIKPNPGNTYPNTIMNFAADGTLEKKTAHNEKGDSLPVENHTPADNIREPIDPDIIVQRPFEDPPHTITRVRYSGYGRY